MPTEPSENKPIPSKLYETPSQPSGKPNREWCIEQIGKLAVIFGESVTPERLRIYAADLVSDLTQEQIKTAVFRARRELKFFPKIAELRDMAGSRAEDQHKVEAEAAWKFANDYLRKWGVDLLPTFSGGREIKPPALPPRIEYALRRIGGLWALNQVTTESYPFKYKEFCEAYQLAPMAESMFPQLAGKGLTSLPEPVRKFLAPAQAIESQQKREAQPIRRVPAEMTDIMLQDRREILKQQMQMIMAAKQVAPVTEAR